MNYRNILSILIPTLTLSIALPIEVVLAQDTPSTTDNSEAENAGMLEEVVVTGTAGGAGMRKQDASFAITTISEADIQQASIKSTAEVFTLVPGVWAESSGGVSGANIDVRGLPGGGDAPFVTMSINGAPIYGTEMLSFMEQSTLFRMDETIARTEALRGGPNAVFSNGEPGVTMNFTLKRGSEETEGRVKYTISDYDLQRADLVFSGKLADDFYFMIGGYVKSSPGIRDAEFNSEEGRQITVNLTRGFDNGELNIFTRVTDDHGQWYLPIALNTGNDLGEFSQLGNATRFRELEVNANGDKKTFDFADGRGWDGSVSGLNFVYDLGNGWTLNDNASYTKGDADTFGLVPDGAPVLVSALAGGTAKTLGGEVLSGNEYVQNYGHWVVQKDLESFTNDLSIHKQIEGHDLTVGYYQATWSSDDFWTLGNFTPLHNVANGDFLDASTTCQDLQAAGSSSGCWKFGIESAGDARTDALYIADSWQVNDALRIDAGLRQEWIDLDYVLDAGALPDGVRDLAVNLTDNERAYTVAVNYDFSESLGAFARFSDGFLFPHFDDIRENNLGTNGVTQYEIGLKYSNETYRAYLTGFFNENDSFDSIVGGVGVSSTAFKTESLGLELDAQLKFDALKFAIIGTWQDTEVTNADQASLLGNQVLRQPDWQIRVAPSYDIEIGGTLVTVYGTFTAVDDRFGDLANTVVLSGYEKYDAGVIVSLENGLFFQAQADNLSDTVGLTEGDPRNPTSPNGRPILGRSYMFSVGLDF